jgi:hypothetical protein
MNLMKYLIEELEKYEKKAEETTNTEMRLYYLGKVNGLQIALHCVLKQKGEDTSE